MTTTTNTANARQIGLFDVQEVERSAKMHTQTKLNMLRVFSAFYDQPEVARAATAAIERIQTKEEVSVTSGAGEIHDSIYFRLHELAKGKEWKQWSYHHKKGSTWVAYPQPE